MNKKSYHLKKVCEICGDRSNGRNFGAISCESCKAFFRRNASKTDWLICGYGEKCNISLKTRKLCKKCRLNKCYFAGMKKEYIFDEEMKEIRNNIIETNKCKKFIENITISPFKSTVLNNYSNYSTILDNLNKVVEKQKYSTITLTFDNREQTSEKLILYKLIDHDYFNSLEFKRLTELLSASKTYFHPISQNILSITNQELYIQLMFFKWECDVENITNFSKVLTSFDRICDNDRLALVKYACYDMMSMRHMHYYNQEKEYWTLHLKNNCSASLSLQTFQSFKWNQTLPNSDKNNRYRHLIPVWDWDPIVMDLLTAIVLFNPNRPNVFHKNVIQCEQKIYIYLLKRYLRIHFRSDFEANSKFCESIDLLQKLLKKSHQLLNDIIKVRFRHNYGPLMREVLDL